RGPRRPCARLFVAKSRIDRDADHGNAELPALAVKKVEVADLAIGGGQHVVVVFPEVQHDDLVFEHCRIDRRAVEVVQLEWWSRGADRLSRQFGDIHRAALLLGDVASDERCEVFERRTLRRLTQWSSQLRARGLCIAWKVGSRVAFSLVDRVGNWSQLCGELDAGRGLVAIKSRGIGQLQDQLESIASAKD